MLHSAQVSIRSTRILAVLALAALPGLVSCYAPGNSGVAGLASLAPSIQAQPQSQTVPLDGTATFLVTGGGSPLPSYQWQRSNDDGATWTNVAGATLGTYALTHASSSDNQAEFRVVLSDPGGTTISQVATLSVSATTGTSQNVVSLPPGSVPLGITVGSDGNLWFTSSGLGQIGKLDALTHEVSLVSLANPACKPVGIAAGSDGNLWFTEQLSGKVGVITTAGLVKGEFTVGSGPTGITAGPDGNLWFTLQNDGKIGKVTTSGLVSLYALPTPGSMPTGITMAADGALWFTEQAAGNIGRISPGGSITEYAAQPPAGGVQPTPQGITSTADGSIWYSDPANNCIAKFPTSSQPLPGHAARLRRTRGGPLMVEVYFPLGTGANPSGLTPDAGGNVWIAEQGSGQLGVITPTTGGGTPPATFPLPTPTGQPTGIAQGPDGNLWVTESAKDDLALVVDTTLAGTVALTTTPATVTLYAGQSWNLRAIVEGLPETAVVWSIQEPGGGTLLGSTGIYTAPQTAGVYHVTASTLTVPPVTATATVTVTVPSISAVTPSAQIVNPGDVVTFSALVTGLPDASIVWSASAGVIDPLTGIWTAPLNAGTVTITATSSLDPALTSTFQVLLAPAAPVIVTQPANQTVSLGSLASFSVVATGLPAPTGYQWQESMDGISWVTIPGATLATWTTPPTVAGDSGSLYRVLVTNAVGTSTSASAVLTISPQAPTFTTQPMSQTLASGSPATFTAAALGEPAPTYQWQLSTDGGNTWKPIPGATGSSYLTGLLGASDDGSLYTVVATNANGTATSVTAHLAVTYAPAITTQPLSQGVSVGAAASFFVTAVGDPAPAYQWQVSTDSGVTWNAIPGATAAAYLIPVTLAGQNGNLFRVVVTNGIGSGATSNPVSLTLGSLSLSIITQPTAQSVAAGAAATFTVTAAGQPAPAYQWQVSHDGGVTWGNVANGSGGTTAAYTTSATVSADDGSLFQVVVSNTTGSTTSASAHLTVTFAPVIVTQPANQIVNLGSQASFAVVASSDPAPSGYQWQVSLDGGTTWNPPANGSGAATATFTTAPVGYADGGSLFQVLVTNGSGTTKTVPALLTISPLAPIITTQPTAQVVASGAQATFTALATGEPAPSYQWQVLTKGAPNWAPIAGATSATYQTPVTASTDDGSLFQVVAFNGNGTATSTTAALTVQYLSVTTPQPQTVAAGASATFSVTATCDPAPTSYQWQVSTDGGATFNNVGNGSGATTAVYQTGSTLSSQDGNLFQVVVGNGVGTVTSGSALLTVKYLTVGPTTPATQTVVAGTTATFTAAVAGDPAAYTYQWQSYVNVDSPWNNVATGGNGPSYTTQPTIPQNDGMQFRVIVTNGGAPVTSAPATLNVVNPPNITVSAGDVQIAPGMGTTFSAFVQANPSPTSFQWQVLVGSTWTNSGTASPANSPLVLNGLTSSTQARIIVTNPVGTITSAPATVAVVTPYADTWMAAGNNHSLWIKPGVGAYASGRNDLGELGDNAWVHAQTFQPVSYQGTAPAGIALVDAAGEHSLAVDTSNNVWWWGQNNTVLNANSPIAVPVALTTVTTPPVPVMLADNALSSFILMQDGTVQQVLSGTTTASPFSPFTGLNIVAIAALDVDGGPNKAQAVIGLDNTGALWPAEANSDGIYGLGTQMTAPPSGSPLVAIYAGKDANVLGIDAQGTLWQWANLDPATPAAPIALPFSGKCVALAKGSGFLLGLGSNGLVQASGLNGEAQLGQNNNNSTTGFVTIYTPSGVQAVAAGAAFAMARDVQGNLWTWGFEGFGELATNTTAVTGLNYLPWGESPLNPPWPQPVASSADVIAYGTNPPQYWIWGSDPGLYLSSAPPSNAFPEGGPAGLPGPGQVFSSSVSSHALVLDPSGNLWGWGNNASGQLGNTTTTNPGSPFYTQVSFPNATRIVLAATGANHSLALDIGGNLWGWGDDNAGELGDGATNLGTHPTPYLPISTSPLIGGEYVTALACGAQHSVGITNFGNLFAWGGNIHGQLGNGAALPDLGFYPPASPNIFATTHPPLTQVSAGLQHTLALDSTGQVWAWGSNQFGQVGNASLVDQAAPVVVTTLYMGGAGKPLILAGPTFSLAMDTNGTVFGWGDNSQGVLTTLTGSDVNGLINTVITTPQVVPGLFTFGYLTATGSSVVATDTNGNLWTWGWNNNGLLGIGNGLQGGTYYFAAQPVQVTLP